MTLAQLQELLCLSQVRERPAQTGKLGTLLLHLHAQNAATLAVTVCQLEAVCGPIRRTHLISPSLPHPPPRFTQNMLKGWSCVQCRYSLSPFLSGLVVSSSLFGALAGSVGAFIIGDKLGRRRELMLAACLYGEPLCMSAHLLACCCCCWLHQAERGFG